MKFNLLFEIQGPKDKDGGFDENLLSLTWWKRTLMSQLSCSPSFCRSTAKNIKLQPRLAILPR